MTRRTTSGQSSELIYNLNYLYWIWLYENSFRISDTSNTEFCFAYFCIYLEDFVMLMHTCISKFFIHTFRKRFWLVCSCLNLQQLATIFLVFNKKKTFFSTVVKIFGFVHVRKYNLVQLNTRVYHRTCILHTLWS